MSAAEVDNTVMKEFFSCHSTLNPEDAFPARTRNDKRETGRFGRISCHCSEKYLIYMYIYFNNNVYCCYVKRHFLLFMAKRMRRRRVNGT